MYLFLSNQLNNKMAIFTPRQKKLILNGTIALSTTSTKCIPNVIAVASCKIPQDGKILITDNFMNKTRKNLLENPIVALAVWSDDGEEGYQFKGTAEYITSGKMKDAVDNDPDNKGLAHKAAVLVTVNEIINLAVWS
jgi:predicted pyridoxine 5'-phosphate oxidase superfamily flavin-nucleotide-binding protein